jgi:hypothetical protein
VTDGSSRAEVTITGLPGGAGGKVANILRWRDQVGLPPAKEADILKDVQRIKAAGVDADYVDLVGKSRILGVILPLGQVTWFVKMTGPPDLVGREKTNFERFIRSFRPAIEE